MQLGRNKEPGEDFVQLKNLIIDTKKMVAYEYGHRKPSYRVFKTP